MKYYRQMEYRSLYLFAFVGNEDLVNFKGEKSKVINNFHAKFLNF